MRFSAGWAALVVALAVAASVMGFLGRWGYAVAGFAAAVFAAGAAVAARGKSDPATNREIRHQKGPGMERRRLLMGLGALGAGLVAALVVVPSARQAGRAAARLRDSGWEAGIPLVDSDGRRIPAEAIVPGALFTVYPEGRLGDSLGQAILVGVEPERIRLPEERSTWAPEGVLAYSKLCTHMACPVGLYQQQFGTVVCPCHQAVFDLLVGGQVLTGPARRPLPQLPIATEAEGHLVASGDFSDFVGTGFWSPR